MLRAAGYRAGRLDDERTRSADALTASWSSRMVLVRTCSS